MGIFIDTTVEVMEALAFRVVTAVARENGRTREFNCFLAKYTERETFWSVVTKKSAETRGRPMRYYSDAGAVKIISQAQRRYGPVSHTTTAFPPPPSPKT
ncbi:unnamed protein product [Xylocopa violacea]|uniref:Uncharacterized protein n=1 Tax=Xylocopa violacea TaxID=135666 RepID=A0ABP1MZ71_XYLVO